MGIFHTDKEDGVEMMLCELCNDRIIKTKSKRCINCFGKPNKSAPGTIEELEKETYGTTIRGFGARSIWT